MSAGNTTDQLDFAHHVETYKGHIGHGNLESDRYFTHQAQHDPHRAVVALRPTSKRLLQPPRHADRLVPGRSVGYRGSEWGREPE